MKYEWLESGRVLKVLAPAKINLYLEILGVRPDGFHEIDTLIQAVSLYDTLTFQPIEGGEEDRLIVRAFDGREGPPADQNNLVLRAIRSVREVLNENGDPQPPYLEVTLEKGTPMGAGMGGGSSDAAASLLAVDRLWDLGWSREVLSELCAQLGSDVAFFLTGGLARCTGRGEVITPISEMNSGESFYYVLVSPALEVPTALIYKELKAVREQGKALTRSMGLNNMSHNSICEELIRISSSTSSPFWEAHENQSSAENPKAELEERGEEVNEELLGKLEADGIPKDLYFNRLQEVAFDVYPQLATMYQDMKAESFLRVLLTGSGSTLYGLCHSAEHAEKCATRLRRLEHGLWDKAAVVVVESLRAWV